MPAQTAKSRFTSVLKANAATPVDWGDDFGELPGGINANEGIAALSVIRIQPVKQGKDQGKPLLYAAGIVESPVEALTRKMVWNPKLTRMEGGVVKNGAPELVAGSTKTMKVKNLRTQVFIKMYATGKGDSEVSEAENIEKANVVMKRLFGQNFVVDNGIETDEDLDAFLEAMSKADPPIRFRFSTQWNPPHEGDDGTIYEDGIWPHKWHGTQGIGDVVPEAGSNGQAHKEEAKQPPAPTPAPKEQPAGRPDPKPPQDGKELDFDVMAQKAENKDMDARKRLREAALANGWTSDQIDDPTSVGLEDSWPSVAQMAKQGPTKQDENEPNADTIQDQPEWIPAVGDQCWVQLRDKNGKPAMGANRKPKPLASAEVKKLYPKDEVADCLDADDKKSVYAKVPYSDLTQA